MSGSFGMSTGNPRNSKNTLEFLDVYLQKYGQGYVSNLLENEGWQTMADPVTGKQLIFQDNDFQKATFTTGQKHEIDLSFSRQTPCFTQFIVSIKQNAVILIIRTSKNTILIQIS